MPTGAFLMQPAVVMAAKTPVLSGEHAHCLLIQVTQQRRWTLGGGGGGAG